jgi:hypothetical protein
MSRWMGVGICAVVGFAAGFGAMAWSQQSPPECWVLQRDAVLGNRSAQATLPANTPIWFPSSSQDVGEVRVYHQGGFTRCEEGSVPVAVQLEVRDPSP